jgi:LDH2 family malate/lactate/ureidoglycolate dehydrogenase
MPLGGDEINSGYKGYGLAMMVELLCGLMSGSKYAQNIRHWTSYSEVDPECFAPGLSDRLKVTGH